MPARGCGTRGTDFDRAHQHLAQIVVWNVDNRTGLEFARDDRGKYLLEEVRSLLKPSRRPLSLFQPDCDAGLLGVKGCT